MSASLSGCGALARNNYFLPGGFDPNSPVAAQVEAAERAPGPMPRFSQIPAMPTDIRPLSAWRADIGDTLNQKRQTDAVVAAYPFSLSNTEGFAAETRARIPPAEAAAPTVDATAAADAYADKERGRAIQPPPPK